MQEELVQRGRARLRAPLMCAAALAALAGNAVAQNIVKCESQNYGQSECRIGGGPVFIQRQISAAECVEGRTWGFDGSRNVIWVTNGCAAEFRVGRAGGYGGAGNASITLYENDGFSGNTYGATNSVSNLADTGFNDRASSVIVKRGRWQICENAYFRGHCETLGPGEYPSLRAMGLNDRVSSVREMSWTPDGSGGWNGNNSYNNDVGYNNSWNSNNGNYGGGNWGSGSRAVLFSGYNLSGQAFIVSPGGVDNLDRTGFNDKARSLRVESGYWMFCTDAYFQGNCHTYGPGDYASLPGGQDHRISSGRRISSNYPYRNSPNWNGY